MKARVLLLDDEPVIVDTLATILNQHGYDARAVYRHDAAIEAAHTFAPQVFYTGVVNVGKNGCETAVELLPIRPSCQILISSGSLGGIEIFKEYVSAGYDFEFVGRPTGAQELLDCLRRKGFPPDAIE